MAKEKETKIKNLTPHKIVLIDENRNKIEIPSDGVVRVSEVSEKIGNLNGIKIVKKKFTGISKDVIKKVKEDLEEGYILVSLLTAKALKESKAFSDEEFKRILFIANTIRDNEGKVIGADALGRAYDL